MKKEIKTKLKDIASAIFDECSVDEESNLQHSYTLIIRTDTTTTIDAYISVIRSRNYPIRWNCVYLCDDDDATNVSGFKITFTDEDKKQ